MTRHLRQSVSVTSDSKTANQCVQNHGILKNPLVVASNS